MTIVTHYGASHWCLAKAILERLARGCRDRGADESVTIGRASHTCKRALTLKVSEAFLYTAVHFTGHAAVVSQGAVIQCNWTALAEDP